MTRRKLSAFLLTMFFAAFAVAQSGAKAGAGPQAKSPAGNQVAVALQQSIRAGKLENLRWPNFPDFKVHVESFYRASNYALAWIQQGKASSRAQEMMQVFLDADREGLNPEDYDGPRWAERVARLRNADPQEQARFDLALTVCAMRYISALRIGRIDPLHFKFGYDVQHKKLDLPAYLRRVIAQVSQPGRDLGHPYEALKTELAKIEPPFAEYRDTRVALLKYEELAKQDDGGELPPPPGILFPGGPYDGIARLAKFLRLVGDLPPDAILPADGKTYDGALVDAVKKFQERHGLAPNGYMTQETVEQLNVPLSVRVEQLRLALERYRWLRYTFARPPVVVNLPGFRLYGFDGHGRVALTMRVNVGDAYDFQTPVFENNIRFLVFRPYWNVPPRILREEVIPDIAADRNYVRDHEMEVTTMAGAVVASGVISDEVLRQLRAGKLLVRQRPGPENPLGLVKVMFPNEHHVYLHDTPASIDMFASDERALSHGCIHLQHPAELARWLLRDKPEWTAERVERAMHEGKDNVTVNLTGPVPILIVYATAVVDGSGDAHFYRDIYGHDRTLQAELAKGYPYP